MSLAVFNKTLRDTLLLLVVVIVAIVAFETLFFRAMSEYSADILSLWSRRPGLKNLIQVLVGAEFAVDISITGLMTIGLAHPLLFALVWTFLLTTCTRVISGEIERGTADLLMSLPVSRVSIYVSTSLVWLLAGVLICAAAPLGLTLADGYFALKNRLEPWRFVIPAVNFYALFVAIGGASMMVSAMIARRGMAVAVLLAGLLASFLINFLAQLWPAAERFGFLGILHYYRPLAAVRDQAWPVRDLIVLGTAAGVTWLVGMWRFSRRDVPAA